MRNCQGPVTRRQQGKGRRSVFRSALTCCLPCLTASAAHGLTVRAGRRGHGMSAIHVQMQWRFSIAAFLFHNLSFFLSNEYPRLFKSQSQHFPGRPSESPPRRPFCRLRLAASCWALHTRQAMVGGRHWRSQGDTKSVPLARYSKILPHVRVHCQPSWALCRSAECKENHCLGFLIVSPSLNNCCKVQRTKYLAAFCCEFGDCSPIRTVPPSRVSWRLN